VRLGAKVVTGDAFDQASLDCAFAGVDIVISCLGGWGDLFTAHQNVYQACIANKVKRVVPAQFGADVLSLPESAMDNYFKLKKSWNEAGINSGIPYTIVSQGAFGQWTLGSQNFFIDHENGTVLYVGNPNMKGWLTTSMEDTSRFTVDCALDPDFANKRVAIAGATVSANDMVESLTRVMGKAYSAKEYKTLEQCLADLKDPNKPKEAFNNSLMANWAQGTFKLGFEPPYTFDIKARFGWEPENFDALVARLLKPGKKLL
jgi:uncharacterized protein YbjT (DUF2867 family)